MSRRNTNDPYFDWLCMKIGVDSRNPKRNYGQMVAMLHGVNYIPIMKLDENRASDGIQLRVAFMNAHGPYGSSTNRGPCTVLEFLIALASKMNFLMGAEENSHRTEWYFWRMISHLGIRKLTDDFWEISKGEFFVEDACDRIMNRCYNPDGSGGLFPLKEPTKDQTQVEVWNQMQAWLYENSDIDLTMDDDDFYYDITERRDN